MPTITFVRHGESQANAGGISTRHAAIALTDLGHAQAQALGEVLPGPPARVLASPYVRAQHTAGPYAARWGLVVQTEDLLHEMDAIAYDCIAGMGGAQRTDVAAAYWQAGDPHRRTGPEVETFAEFATRVLAFRRQVLPQLPDGTVVFGHGLWMAMLCWQLQGFSAGDAEAMRHFRAFQQGLPMANAAVYRVQQAASGIWCAQADAAAQCQVQERAQGALGGTGCS